ncbi:ZINC FINGER FYVE DOMAIN CONTAINING PROTEIN [Salix koriyanagi]|uniref:ZINC FINGER FYVE DOMAIN CONTAINING PROTEIN n=1 Tax=Salix koriyanagi TaxID=2511006 RepID=A0A9Q0P7I8_9ROSI|nr:ZINC FINGER FYVE DOMAIN CONTAINING PROTEIN [Salix koriyanagi]
MASSKIIIAPVLISFFFLAAVLPYESNAKSLKSCGFDAIYQLGDSISDTGNFIQEKPSAVYARFPYGETFFNRPTVPVVSGELNLLGPLQQVQQVFPFLDAYLNPNGTFTRGHGVNFAVASSTALPADFLSKKRIFPPTYSSLSVQLDWMFSHFNSICFSDEKDCVEKLKNSLFMVGEIGVNDYTYAFFHGKTMEEVKNMVPDVVQAIRDAVKRVIGYGARRVAVPGNAPIGFNNLSAYHNDLLKQAIEELKRENPNVVIAYADYYNAFQWILTSARFDAKSTHKACCGTGGDYGYDAMKMCGAPGVPVCPQPDRYISWDGVDLTQKAYQYMALWIIDDILPKLRCPA